MDAITTGLLLKLLLANILIGFLIALLIYVLIKNDQQKAYKNLFNYLLISSSILFVGILLKLIF